MNKLFATYERANFDIVGLFIDLKRYDKSKFDEIFSNPITELTLDDWKIYYHEYRHWIDTVGTNYGQEYLYTSFQMLDYGLKKEPYKLSPINPMVLHQLLEENGNIEILIRERIESDDPSLKWKIDKEFSHLKNIPIYQIKFIKQDNTPVCKTPITFLSLFETNAIYEELHLYHHFSEKINKDNPSKSFIDIIEYSEQSKRAYNSELIDYSAATHLISTYFEIPAILNAYDVASQICTILLNLTEDQLLILRRKLKVRHVFHPYFFMNRDFGYILYCICLDYRRIQKGNPYFNVHEFLEYFELPKIEQTEQEIIDEMVRRTSHFEKNSHLYKRYMGIAMNGIDIFYTMGLNSRKKTMMTYLNEGNFKIEPYLKYGDEIWDETQLTDILQKDILKLTKHEWFDFVYETRISQEELLKNVE